MARTLPIGGRGTSVPVSAASLGRGSSPLVPVARDGRSVPDPGRRGPASTLARQDRCDGVRASLRTVADRERLVTSPGRAPSARSIRPLGLVRRASTLKTLASEVAELGEVPDSMAELLELPGVGKYAASATLAVAFEKPLRWSTASARGSTAGTSGWSRRSRHHPTELWEVVAKVTPRQRVREWNWAVLDLAAAVCLPKVPRCEECPLRTCCAWSQGSVDRVRGPCYSPPWITGL